MADDGVADLLERRRADFGLVILDPVMVATSGDKLLRDDAIATVRERLLRLADVVTPNAPEAAVLLGTQPARDTDDLTAQALALRELGARAAIVKGGHLEGEVMTDVFATADATSLLSGPRVETRNTHGTGCTYSAAIAALLPQREHVPSAVREAHAWLARAIARADELAVAGSPEGHGPVHHFHALWPSR